MNNRFGHHYFCGERNPCTDRDFDGIESCRRAYSKKEDIFQGRCYSRAELRHMKRGSKGAEGREYINLLFKIAEEIKDLSYEEKKQKEYLESGMSRAYICQDNTNKDLAIYEAKNVLAVHLAFGHQKKE